MCVLDVAGACPTADDLAVRPWPCGVVQPCAVAWPCALAPLPGHAPLPCPWSAGPTNPGRRKCQPVQCQPVLVVLRATCCQLFATTCRISKTFQYYFQPHTFYDALLFFVRSRISLYTRPHLAPPGQVLVPCRPEARGRRAGPRARRPGLASGRHDRFSGESATVAPTAQGEP